jgi:hypothetical protein
MESEIAFGRNLLELLNGIKRRPEDASKELGTNLDDLLKIIQGEKKVDYAFINNICDKYPLNPRDFFSINDNTKKGISFTSLGDSLKSSRVIQRDGIDYYEYRDTATSSICALKPEWIKELVILKENDPESALIKWNRGHLLHQFTYFVGPVNFHFIDTSGNKRLEQMNTGDSMYISPFIPHSFTTRKEGQGHILALTFGSSLEGDPRHELNAIGFDLSKNFCLGSKGSKKNSGNLIQYFMNASSATPSFISEQADIQKERLKALTQGLSEPNPKEISDIAKVLNISTRDLMVPDIVDETVVIKTVNNTKKWSYPENKNLYSFRALAQPIGIPDCKGFEIDVQNESSENYFDFSVGNHTYLFNIGDTPLDIIWEFEDEKNKLRLESSDSIYLKPFLPHSIIGRGKLLNFRISSRITPEVINEISNIGKESFHRLFFSNIKQWFKQ